jgi:P pilus assembly chaperone PapD
MAGKLFRSGTALRAMLAAAALTVAATEVAHAVTVSPTALYIDSRTRSGVLTLYNPGSLPAEVTIDFAFGYPQSDALGNVSVPLTREPAAGEPSALEWMRAFPRRLVLQPGQRQVVRVLVEPPAGLPEGEYWARVLISSRGGQPPIEETQGDLQLQLNVQTTLVIAANYRNGSVATGVEVASAAAAREGEGVALDLELHRTGNAAFLGRVRADLLDAGGAVISSTFDDVAVYRTMRRRLVLPVPDGTAGPLSVRLTVNTDRDDLPPGGALAAAPVERSVPVAP